MIAGHETTAATLGFTLQMLGVNAADRKVTVFEQSSAILRLSSRILSFHCTEATG